MIRRKRDLIGGVLAMAVLAVVGTSALLAKPGIVKNNDGAVFQGDVTSDERYVHITNTRGIRTTVDKRNVASIEYVEDPAEQFKKQLAALAPNDINGRIALARLAYEGRRYTDARDALDSALAIDANNADASQLLDTVQKQMRLERNTGTATPAETGGAATTTETTANPTTTAPVAGQATFLTAADINRIRQMEWQQNDRNMRVRFKGDVKRRYVQMKALDPRQFNAMNAADQAWAILTEHNSDLSKDVELLSDPGAIADFRKPAVYGKILAGCAAAGCHGTTGAGGFMLHTSGDNESQVYTNFYILQTFRKNIGERVYTMIDRQTPDQSLLLQYGLPADIAELDHPPVLSYRGIFRGKTDPTYRAVESWMRSSLPIIVPDYKIEYKAPSTQPAAAPTTAPAQ